MRILLLEINPRPSGSVETVWRLATGARRRVVIHAGAYDEAGIAQVRAALERQAET